MLIGGVPCHEANLQPRGARAIMEAPRGGPFSQDNARTKIAAGSGRTGPSKHRAPAGTRTPHTAVGTLQSHLRGGHHPPHGQGLPPGDKPMLSGLLRGCRTSTPSPLQGTSEALRHDLRVIPSDVGRVARTRAAKQGTKRTATRCASHPAPCAAHCAPRISAKGDPLDPVLLAGHRLGRKTRTYPGAQATRGTRTLASLRMGPTSQRPPSPVHVPRPRLRNPFNLV